MVRLAGKQCVITGDGRGIAFTREGADVAVIDRLADNAERVSAEINRLSVRGFAFSTNVADETSITKALRGRGAIGGVDVLMNNAGINTHVQLVDMTVATWDEMIAVKLGSVFPCTRTVLPGMIERRCGRIVSTSSQLAHKGGRQLTHYAAAEVGVFGFTRSLAYEVTQYDIAVNAIWRDQSTPTCHWSVRRNEGPKTFRAPARASRRGRGSRPDRRPYRLR